MTRPIQYACEDGHCECGACPITTTRNIDLDALKGFTRASYTFGLSLLLVFAIAIILAAGFVRTESIHRDIVFKRSV